MRVKAAFRENRNLTDPAVVKTLKAEGYKNLAIIKRQVITIPFFFIKHERTRYANKIFPSIQVVIGHMFEPDRLVIEKPMN